jgi:hypothetical protein
MTYDVRCYPDTRGQQQVANKHASWLRPGRKQRSYVQTPIHTFLRVTGPYLQRVAAGTDWARGWMFQDSIPNRDKRRFSFPKSPDRLWGTPSLSFRVYHVISPEIKRPGRDLDNSPPSSVHIENQWSCSFTPSYACMTCTWALIYMSFITNMTTVKLLVFLFGIRWTDLVVVL